MSFNTAQVENHLHVTSTICRDLIDCDTPAIQLNHLLYHIASIVESIPPEHQELQKRSKAMLAELLNLHTALAMRQGIEKSESYFSPISTINLSESSDTSSETMLIERLLKVQTAIALLREMRPSSQTTAAIEDKLNELTRLVKQIPKSNENLYEFWNYKLNQLLGTTADSDSSPPPPVNPPAPTTKLRHTKECDLVRLEKSIILFLTVNSPPWGVLLMKLCKMKQLLDQLPSADLKAQWNEKFSGLMAKCADLSNLSRSEHSASEHSSSVKSDTRSSSSALNDAKMSLAEDVTRMLEDELEDSEAMILDLMNSQPVDRNLVEEKINELMEAVQQHFADSSKWLEKVGNLIARYGQL